MKKLLLLLMACFMMVFCFAACGSSDEDADVDEESSVSDEVEDSEDEDSEAEDSEAEDSAADEESEAEDEESGASSLYVGTWKLSYVIDPDGNSLSIEEYYTAIGQADAYSEEAADASFTFNDDGTGVATVAGVDVDLTWTVDDSNVITYTTSAGTSSTLAFNGEDAMTYEDASSGYTSVYEK